MNRWLVKEEPTHYSFEDFRRDGETEWSGVHNPSALLHLRAMRPGDVGFYYHTGNEKAIVGTFSVTGAPRPDRSDPRPSWVVRLRATESLGRPVALAALRQDRAFAKFDLLRNSRLSILAVPVPVWNRILALSRAPGQASTSPPREKKRSARTRSRGAT
jgi:predicted RNA-binding protein with PUA-like domain